MATEREEAEEMRQIARMMLQVQNVLAKVDLGSSSIGLEEVALHAKDVDLNSHKGSFATLHLRRPSHCSARLYASGSLVLNGAPTEHEAHLCTKKLARRVQRASSSDIRFRNFRVTNLLATASTGFAVDLEGMHSKHSDLCEWEPERTPGLVVSLGCARCIVHGSGKVSISGCRSFDKAVDVFATLYPLMQDSRKGKGTITEVSAAGTAVRA